MAALTAATTVRESVGSLTILVFTFTSVNNGDTFDSGLGTNIWHSWAQSGSQTTQASAGINFSRVLGVYTLKPGEDGNSAGLFVLARV